MTPSYFISIAGTQDDPEFFISIFNIAGVGRNIHGEYSNNMCKCLWIIPKGKENEQEVFKKLQSLPNIQTVNVVSLSNPVEPNQLVAVRSAFKNIGWDASNVTDHHLSLYLNSWLKMQCKHYVDIDHKNRNKGLVKVQLKPIEQHPQFSPDWLEGDNNVLEELETLAKEFEHKEFTINDFETETVTFEMTDDPEEDHEPPASPGIDPNK